MLRILMFSVFLILLMVPAVTIAGDHPRTLTDFKNMESTGIAVFANTAAEQIIIENNDEKNMATAIANDQTFRITNWSAINEAVDADQPRRSILKLPDQTPGNYLNLRDDGPAINRHNYRHRRPNSNLG